jgi:hypothetical protein
VVVINCKINKQKYGDLINNNNNKTCFDNRGGC